MFGSDHKGAVYACAHPELNAAIIYYGTSPNSAELVKLNVPVLGLHGGDDARVGATVEPASAEIKKLGKTFEYEMYEGAGHGFLRAKRPQRRKSSYDRKSLAANARSSK